MRDLTTAELEALRVAAEESMQDECYILRRTRTQNSYGEPTDAYAADSASVRCGYHEVGQATAWRTDVDVTQVDAVLRLPIDTDIDLTCHVRIDERHGEDITSETFEVASEPRRGPSALRVELRRLTDPEEQP